MCVREGFQITVRQSAIRQAECLPAILFCDVAVMLEGMEEAPAILLELVLVF